MNPVRKPASSATEDAQHTSSDAALMARLAAGQLAALGTLFDRHHAAVRRFIASATTNGADVDDLVQDVFLTLARAAPSFDGRENARPFLFGIAAQLARRRRRSLGRLTRVLERFGWVAATPPRTPEQDAGAAEECASFERALASLSEEKRLVFVLFEREGLRGDEVAEALSIPVNTVWTRLHHARAELRRSVTRSSALAVRPSAAAPGAGVAAEVHGASGRKS